jgi:hypothetical protein
MPTEHILVRGHQQIMSPGQAVAQPRTDARQLRRAVRHGRQAFTTQGPLRSLRAFVLRMSIKSESLMC